MMTASRPLVALRNAVIGRQYLHAQSHLASSVPKPTPFVPDPSTFLTLIGRGLSTHASKFPTWDSLFTLSSDQMKELGIEPARSRKYLLWWRDRFRNGQMGIGGDLQHVKEGEAQVRIIEVPIQRQGQTEYLLGNDEDGVPLQVKKVVVNTPQDEAEGNTQPVQGLQVKGARTIVGPYVQPIKGSRGSAAVIKVQEGMWEVRRGIKVDGGQRRKAEVRRKRIIEARKMQRT